MIVVGRACFMAPRDPAGQRQQRGAAEPRPLRQRECLFRRSNGGGLRTASRLGRTTWPPTAPPVTRPRPTSSEPPRVSRRLRLLRGWSHGNQENSEELLA